MATRTSPAPRPGTPIENRNFLSPVGFKFALKRVPKVAFFCNQANIPDLTLGIAEQPTYLKNIPVPGDKIEFGDLNLTLKGVQVLLSFAMKPIFLILL